MKKKYLIDVIKSLSVLFLFFFSGYIKGALALLFGMNTKKLTNQDYILLTLVTDVILLLCFFLIYRKDLKREWQNFKGSLSKNLDTGLKYWLLGLAVMMISNLLIATFTPLTNSENERAVQSLIPSAPFLMFLAAGIFAPIIEEITFRKTLRGIFKNKWVFAISSFLLFGFIHISGSITTPYEILYIIPYGALGFTFALAYQETDSVFTSISMHALHNSLLILLAIFV